MFSFIGTKIKWTIIVMLVIGLGIVVWWNRELIEDKAQLAVTVVQQRVTLEEMEEQQELERKRREEAERIAVQYKQQRDQIYKEARNLREYIGELESQNEEVKEWAETDMPAPIIDAVTDGVHEDSDDNED